MDKNIKLVLGGRKKKHVIDKADQLLLEYRLEPDYLYMQYDPKTLPLVILPQDLEATFLIHSNAGSIAFKSVQDNLHSPLLAILPQKPLERVSDDELKVTAQLIANIAQWPGFAASVATKLLHKKRPDLIPLLDNRAIFWAYMRPDWPSQLSVNETYKKQSEIELALRWIRADLRSRRNAKVWPALRALEPKFSVLQLFTGVWWMYFYKVERQAKAGQLGPGR